GDVARRAGRHVGRRAGQLPARGDGVAARQVRDRLVEAVLGRRLAEQRSELLLDVAQVDAVLRALRAGQAGRDGAQVELHDLAVVDVARLRDAEELLCPEVRLEGLDLGLGAPGAAEVLDRAA